MATGITDASGNVSFTNVIGGSHSVTVSKQPYNTVTQTINVTVNGQVFTITLTGGVTYYTITVHVQDAAGSPLQSATVDFT